MQEEKECRGVTGNSGGYKREWMNKRRVDEGKIDFGYRTNGGARGPKKKN